MFKYLTVLFAGSAAIAAASATTNDNNDNGVAAADAAPRKLQLTLAEKWNITDPEFDYDGLTFDFDYALSDFIQTGMVTHGLYDVNCREGGYVVPQTDLQSIQGPLPSNAFANVNTKVQQISVAVNPETISSNPNIYEETVVNGEQFAIITFCLRLNLQTLGDSSIEVNFHETLVTLNVDLTDGFAIDDVDVAPRDRLVTTANQAYEVEGYQCDRNYVELTPAARAVTRNQGAIIRVCVRPTLEGREDGIYMREIQSFTFTRADPPATQVAVENSAAANNGLTDLFCEEGWEVCAFETILFAAFYRVSGQVAGAGIASMQFGGSGRRLRALQAAGEEAAVAEFELDFDTVATEDVGGSGASMMSLLSIALLAVGSATALL